MVQEVGARKLGRRPALVVVAGLAAPLWLASCTGESVDANPGAGNSSGAGTSTAGAGAGAMHVAGAPSTTGGASSSAGRGTAGAAGGAAGASATSGGAGRSGGGTGGDAGTSGGMGGDAGTGGGSSIGGRGPMPGFACGDLTCMSGQTCVSCSVGVTPTYESLCAPNQNDDPDGYAQAIKDCQMVTGVAMCDGPEDCKAGEHCVYTSLSHGQPICEAEPTVGVDANCCFSCDALPVCTLCWSDDDCPETFICVHSLGQPLDGPGGCRLGE